MKATIREQVPGVRLADAVPPRYRDEVIKHIDQHGIYTLVLCGHNPRDVNLSSQLARALKRVESVAKDGIIIVGAAFTEEAKALAAERGARIVALHKSARTDESARQRQL
jgi:DNA-binding LacI/PurR family transcriptional regulator